MFPKYFFAGVVCLLSFLQVSAVDAAPEPVALEAQVAQLAETVRALTFKVDEQAREIATLKSTQSSPVSPVASPQAVSAPSIGGVPKFLEIGAVTDVTFLSDSPKADEGGSDRVSVRELELVLGANVDPYSRLDSTVALTEEGAELEEAYLTRFGLPFDLTARVGRFKPRIGKAIGAHRDSLDTVDEPLVIQRYFGAEGMSKSGVDVKKILDLPFPSTHEVTFGVLEGGNGEGGTVFGETKRRPSVYTHLKNYFDLTDTTGLEVGLTHALGSRDADAEFEVNVLGLDGTLTHPLNPLQSLTLQGELFNVNRSGSELETIVDETTGETALDNLDGNVWGGYALLDFRFHPQWSTGFRYDNVERIDRADSRDEGYTGYLTFYQSEFARWRAQFTHLDLTSGAQDNQVLLQGTFAIGEHKHKIQ